MNYFLLNKFLSDFLMCYQCHFHFYTMSLSVNKSYELRLAFSKVTGQTIPSFFKFQIIYRNGRVSTASLICQWSIF